MRVHKRLIGPIILFISVALSLVLSEAGVTPQLGALLKGLFVNAGLAMLAPIVLIEYVYGLNFFFPGALTILFAMSSTSGNLVDAIYTFCIIWAFSLIGCGVSYLLGRLEAGENQTKESPARNINRFLSFLVYGHPLTASIRSFQCGSNNVSAFKFLWNCFWGVISYHNGSVLVSGNSFAIVLIAYSMYWFIQEKRLIQRTAIK
jgi:hypothetical protein